MNEPNERISLIEIPDTIGYFTFAAGSRCKFGVMKLPNRFHRFMQKLFFGIHWTNEKDDPYGIDP